MRFISSWGPFSAKNACCTYSLGSRRMSDAGMVLHGEVARIEALLLSERRGRDATGLPVSRS